MLQPGEIFNLYRSCSRVASSLPPGVGHALKFECAVKAGAWRVKALMTPGDAPVFFHSAAVRLQIMGGVYEYLKQTRDKRCPSMERTPALMWVLALIANASSTSACSESSVEALVAFCKRRYAIVKRNYPSSATFKSATSVLASRYGTSVASILSA